MSRGRRRRAQGSGEYPRTWRVNEVLREIVAEELERLADADERLRLVTVTSVDTTNDLRRATVYLGHLELETAEALEERRPQLQAHLGRQVRLKRTPRLEFAADPSVVAGARVDEILRRLGRAGGPPGPDEGPGSAPGAGA